MEELLADCEKKLQFSLTAVDNEATQKMDKARGRAASLSVDWDKIFGAKLKMLEKEDHIGFNIQEKESFTFVTNSKYKGGWNLIGMASFGTFILPHGVEYEGQLMESMFENEGTLQYPMGHKFEGNWEKDKLMMYKIIFPDGLMYDDAWEYCQMPDRRFFVSIQEGLWSVCQEHLTNDNEARPIPPGCYDTGDGFYDPKTKCVMSSEDSQKVLRIPSLTEERWIIKNCRKAWDEPTGYRPDLYERWVTGRYSEKYEHYDTRKSLDDYASEEED